MRVANLTPKKKIKRAKVQMQNDAPFFSYLITHAQFKPDKDLPAMMGVGPSGYGFYQPDEIDEIDDIDMIEGTLVHEVMHLALEHVWQRTRGKNHAIVNIAQDCVINATINGQFDLPENVWKPDHNGVIEGSVNGVSVRIEDAADKTWYQVYDEIEEQLKESVGEQAGQGDEVETDKEDFDDHKRDEGGQSPYGPEGDEGEEAQDEQEENDSGFAPSSEEAEIDDEEQKSGGQGGEDDEDEDQSESDPGQEDEKGQDKAPKLDKAPARSQDEAGVDWGEVMAEAVQHGRQAGSTPAGIERRVDAKAGHEIDWREELKSHVSKMLPSGYTFQRPSRHSRSSGIRLPGLKKGEKLEVLVSVDASGSIDEELLSQFKDDMIEIARTYETVKMEMFSHDTEVDKEGTTEVRGRNVGEIKDWQPKGGGGTDLVSPFKYADSKFSRTRLLILLTDGQGPRPGTTNYNARIPHIWVLAGDWKTTDDIKTGKVIRVD